jgi:hypothetical protein
MLCKTSQIDKQEGSSHDRHVMESARRPRDDGGTKCEERWLRVWCKGALVVLWCFSSLEGPEAEEA